MLHGASWAARRDRASALVEDPQQRRLAQQMDQGFRRRTEWEERSARRRAEFTARIPAIAAQVASEVCAAIAAEVKSEVSAAIAAAFQATRAGHHEDLALAPTTTTASIISNLALAAPITCSTEGPGRENGATKAMAAPSASVTSGFPSASVVHEGGIHLATSGNEREPDLSMLVPRTVTSTSTAPTSVLTACTVRNGDLDLASPTTCSSLCPGGDPSAPVVSMMASMVLGETAVTIACSAPNGCVYPVAQWLTMPTTVHVDVADCAPTMAAPSVDITLGPATAAPTSSTTHGLNHNTDGDDSVLACLITRSAPTPFITPLENSPMPPLEPTLALELRVIGSSKWPAGETAVGANSMTSLMLDDIQHISQSPMVSDYARSDAQLDAAYKLDMAASHGVVPFKVFSVASTNSVGREDELRPLPWPSFMCCHGGRPSWLPKNQVLFMVGTLPASEGWSLAIERKLWPPPPCIHGSVPAREINAWFLSWLELLLFENDCSLAAWLCCHTTGTCWTNKHMGLTVVNATSYGADNLEFLCCVSVHDCNLIDGFHHEKLWDPGGFHSCAWNCQWRMVLVNCSRRLGAMHSTEQWSPLKGMCGTRSLMQPQEGVDCYQINFDLHATNSCVDLYLQTMAETRSLLCELLSIGNPVKYLVYVQSFLTRGLFSTQPRDYLLMLQRRLPNWWSDTQCFQLTTKILDSYSPLSVNCHFARMHFLLSRRSQINEELNWGTSLDLVAYHGYPALTLTFTSSWKHLWCISGHPVTILCDEQARFSCQCPELHQPWRPPCRAPFSSSLLESQMKLDMQASWMDRMVFKTDGFCRDQMHLGEILSHYHIRLMLWNTIEQELIFVGGNESKYFALLPWQPWFSYYTPGKVILYNSEDLQRRVQQPENENSQLLTAQISYSITTSYVCTVGLFACGHSFEICHHKAILAAYSKVLHIAWDFRGRLFPSTGYGAATAHGEVSLSIPWDPGGAAWWWLEGKPPFKEGGMLTTTFPSTVGPERRWASWHWAGLGQQARRENAIKTRQRTTEKVAWIRTALASSLLSPYFFLTCSCSSAPLHLASFKAHQGPRGQLGSFRRLSWGSGCRTVSRSTWETTCCKGWNDGVGRKFD